MAFTTIDVERAEDWIVLVTLTREKEMNTLSLEFVEEFGQVLQATSRDPAARVLILTGKGRAFCCGAELKYYTTARGTIGPDPIASRKFDWARSPEREACRSSTASWVGAELSNSSC